MIQRRANDSIGYVVSAQALEVEWRCSTTPGFFPTPFPDELFYSLVARFHAQLPFLNPKEIINEIFASRTAAAIFDLSCRIVTFCRQLSEGTLLSPERLIYLHTIYPFYRPFLPTQRAKTIFDEMCSDGKGGAIHASIGALASGVRMLSFLKFCPSCLEDDRRDFREAYWHRSHQLPGIEVCHKHLVPLLESCVSVFSRQQKYLFLPLENVACGVSLPVCQHTKWEVAEFLAVYSHWLLTNRPAVWGLEELHRRYVELLARKALATAFGIVHQRTLLHEFLNYFGKGYLLQIGCPLANESEDNWLSTLVRKPRKATHPLLHLLLMKFLGTSPQDFLGDGFFYTKPFGDPPFPCLNPAASHYLEEVITKVRITRHTDNGCPVGNFYCSCGFAYARSGPDKKKEDRQKRSRIISMGSIWEARLFALANDHSIGLRETARRLGVDTNTVKKYLLGKIIRQRYESASCDGAMFESSKRKYRVRLMEMMQAKPSVSRTELRHIVPACYSWLYRHDREWLLTHLPQCSPKRKYPDNRIDWKIRDEEIALKTTDAIKELLTDPVRLKRVTIGRIARMIGCLGLIEKHLDKLPKTRKVLDGARESVEDFQIRRIRNVSKKLLEEGESLEKWKILRLAGLEPGFSARVGEEVEEQVQKGRQFPWNLK